MNPQTTRTPVIEDEIDLLVDGELPEDRRADLIEKIDREAGGWKRCAQAFLEAQCWSEGMAVAVPAEVGTGATRRRYGWRTPLAAGAAAVMGFVAAFAVGSRESAEDPGTEARGAVAPDPLVRYIPFPVEQGSGLVPVSNEEGTLYYTTRGDVPGFLLRALEEAGHEVEQVERFVNLPREGGEPLELPVRETRVFVNHQL